MWETDSERKCAWSLKDGYIHMWVPDHVAMSTKAQKSRARDAWSRHVTCFLTDGLATNVSNIATVAGMGEF